MGLLCIQQKSEYLALYAFRLGLKARVEVCGLDSGTYFSRSDPCDVLANLPFPGVSPSCKYPKATAMGRILFNIEDGKPIALQDACYRSQ